MMMALIADSCKKKLLDIYPSDALSDIDVWNDLQFVDRFLSNIYGTIPNGYNRRDQQPAMPTGQGV